MEHRVRAALATGAGFVTAAQLRDLGIDPRLTTRWVREGTLVAVRRGVYTSGELWSGWDEFVQRPLARVRAAHLTMRVAHVFSHDSAALVHRLPLIDGRISDVHLTRRRLQGSQVQYGVRHHGAAYRTDQRERVSGLDVLTLPRTVADLAREHGYLSGLVAADGALRIGVGRQLLRDELDSMRCWPGVTVCRAVLDDAVHGAESAGETLMRALVAELGIGPMETQFPVSVASGVRWCDLRVGCHVFEFDGRVKLRPVADGGLATRSAEEVMWREKKRDRAIGGLCLGISHVIWADLWGAARRRTLQRLGAEYAVTRSRYGVVLPVHLEEVAERLRGRRYSGVR